MPPRDIPAVGSRASVFHGNAKHTSGGLTRADLMLKDGRIRSRRASAAAKRTNNLGGYLLPRGTGMFVPGGAPALAAGGGAVPARRRRSSRRSTGRKVCHRGKSFHCGAACIPVGRKCHL